MFKGWRCSKLNIIEIVQDLLLQFPKISEVCNEIHVDFTDTEPTNYGLSSTGDTLITEDLLGNQRRQHNFVLYAVYQSMNDYDRLNNTGVLLDLALWLESQNPSPITKITTANGMIYAIPNENYQDSVQYQLQITAQYKIEREGF